MNQTQENLAIVEIARWQGDHAPIYIAKQLGAVAVAGDAPGIARWQAIAAAYDEVQRGPRQ